MVSNVLPLSWYNNWETFSKIKALGFLLFKIFAISKNKVPLVSLKPFCFPAIENAWHGKPAHKISKSGIWLVSNNETLQKGFIP